jgi:hypothetical protein
MLLALSNSVEDNKFVQYKCYVICMYMYIYMYVYSVYCVTVLKFPSLSVPYLDTRRLLMEGTACAFFKNFHCICVICFLTDSLCLRRDAGNSRPEPTSSFTSRAIMYRSCSCVYTVEHVYTLPVTLNNMGCKY